MDWILDPLVLYHIYRPFDIWYLMANETIFNLPKFYTCWKPVRIELMINQVIRREAAESMLQYEIGKI